jgi:hypothetical protein
MCWELPTRFLPMHWNTGQVGRSWLINTVFMNGHERITLLLKGEKPIKHLSLHNSAMAARENGKQWSSSAMIPRLLLNVL